MTGIKLSDFAVSLVGEQAVFPLTLEFSGEDFCLIGERHAGKTPLMLALAGDLPHTGKIEIDGTDLSALSAKEREIGAVFGARALFPGTIKDNLLYGLKLRGILTEETEARAISMAKRLGIDEEQLALPAKNADDLLALKTAFLRTLVRIPRMIVLDFPVRGEGKEDLALLLSLRELCKKCGVLFLWLTESPAQAALFSFVGVLSRGRLVAFGTREELRRNPALSARELLLLSPYASEVFFRVSGGHMIFSGGNECLLPPESLPDGDYRAVVWEEDGFAFSSEGDPAAISAEITFFERAEEDATETSAPFRCYVDLAAGRADAAFPANAIFRADKPQKEGVRTVFLRPLIENWNVFPLKEGDTGAIKAPKNKKKSRKKQDEKR